MTAILLQYQQLAALFGRFIHGFHVRGQLTRVNIEYVLRAEDAFMRIARECTVQDAVDGVRVLARVLTQPDGIARLRAFAESNFPDSPP